MNLQKNVHNEEERKQTPSKDSEVKRGGTKPTEKPRALHSEYMNIFRSGY